MRRTRSTNARASRTWGEVSGVTFTTTGASGVTVDKSYIQIGTGVSINATSLIHTSQGYPIYQPSLNNINVVAGATQTGGTSRYMSATMLGLNTLTTFIPNIVWGTTGVVLQGDYTVCAFDHTANTGVTVFLFTKAGVTRTTGVSLHYIAVGT